MQSLQIVLFLWFLFAPYYGAHPDVLVVLVNAVFDLSKLSHSEFTRMGPSQASWQGDHLSVAFTDGRSHLGGRSPISGHLSIIIPDPVMAFIRVSIVVIQAVLVWSTRGTALPFTNEQWWWWRCWRWWFSHAPLDLYWIPSQDVGGGGVTWPTSSSGSSSSWRIVLVIMVRRRVMNVRTNLAMVNYWISELWKCETKDENEDTDKELRGMPPRNKNRDIGV